MRKSKRKVNIMACRALHSHDFIRLLFTCIPKEKTVMLKSV
jgi:hypothetical protein